MCCTAECRAAQSHSVENFPLITTFVLIRLELSLWTKSGCVTFCLLPAPVCPIRTFVLASTKAQASDPSISLLLRTKNRSHVFEAILMIVS